MKLGLVDKLGYIVGCEDGALEMDGLWDGVAGLVNPTNAVVPDKAT